MVTLHKKKIIDIKVIQLIDTSKSLTMFDIRNALYKYSPDMVSQAVRTMIHRGLAVDDNGSITRTNKPYTII